MRSQHLTPRELARAIGVSESSLKRWADDGRISVERTAGGHRRIALGEALAFVHRSGLTPVRPELLRASDSAEDHWRPRGGPEQATARLTEALLADRAAEAQSLVVGLFLEGGSLGWICDEVVRPALARLGELWLHGPEGVFLEHRATETCLRALAELRMLQPPTPSDAPVALGGAFGRDVYRVPSAMAGLIVAHAGFRERDLGAEVPPEATLAAVLHHRPALVWQSVSVPPERPREAGQELERIARALGDGMLVIGGRAAEAVPLPRAVNVHRFQSMAELAGFARGIAPLAGAATASARPRR